MSGGAGKKPSPQHSGQGQSRSWSKASSSSNGGAPYRPPLPQSLDAAAELFAAAGEGGAHASGQPASMSPSKSPTPTGLFTPALTSSPTNKRSISPFRSALSQSQRRASTSSRKSTDDRSRPAQGEEGTSPPKLTLKISFDKHPVDVSAIRGGGKDSSSKSTPSSPSPLGSKGKNTYRPKPGMLSANHNKVFIGPAPGGDAVPPTPSDEFGFYSTSVSDHGEVPPSPSLMPLPSSSNVTPGLTPVTPVKGRVASMFPGGVRVKGIGLPVLDAGKWMLCFCLFFSFFSLFPSGF